MLQVSLANPENSAIYTILVLYFATLLGTALFSWWMNTSNRTISLGALRVTGDRVKNQTTSYLGAGTGFTPIIYFFTMAASLFSGYSVAGIASEAFTFGFQATRWICAGVPIYGVFLILSPRLHALGKSRGYLSILEFLYDRFAVSGHPAVAHAIRFVCLFCLQLPVFTYLITQFTGLGQELSVYTKGELTPLACILSAASILLIFSVLGGLRGVAYSDVIQGVALILGAFVFFCCQHIYLGGMGRVSEATRSAAFAESNAFGYANFNNVPKAEGSWSASSWSSFVIKVTIAATMFPHLIQRLFVAKSSAGMRIGFSAMNITFYFIQFASMITGWVAAAYFLDGLPEGGGGVLASVATIIRSAGSTGEFASALIMSAAVCAFMSTADSCMIAFATMWLKDFYLPYIAPGASQMHQLIFSKAMCVLGLFIGVLLATLNVSAANPITLSSLFSLQTVTPIHVAPAVWMGLHWKGLRGEPVLFGILVGLGTTLGLTFDQNYNTKLALGLEENKEGWAPSLIGLAVNVCATVIGGIVLQVAPNLIPLSTEVPRFARPLDIGAEFGEKQGREVHLGYWGGFLVIFMFMFPFYRASDFGKQDTFVEFMPSWAFTSLFVCAILVLYIAFGYWYFWQDYKLVKVKSLYPIHPDDELAQDDDDVVDGKGGVEAGNVPMQAFEPSMPPQQQAFYGGQGPMMMMMMPGMPAPAMQHDLAYYNPAFPGMAVTSPVPQAMPMM